MAVTGVAGRGKVRMPAIFGDHMVLQRGMGLSVWGWAEAGVRVSVTILGQSVEGVADEKGKWKVVLAPMEAGGPVEMVVKAGGGKGLVVQDILIGDVWVCGGQSNMAYGLAGAWGGAEAVAGAGNAKIPANTAGETPAVRLFKVKEVASGEPLEDCVGKWVVCSPETVGEFSAVGYFFGRDVQAAAGVGVGLIHAAWSGTQAECWTPEEAMLEHEETRGIVERYRAGLGDFAARREAYEKKLAAWKELVRAMEGLDGMGGGNAGGMLPPPEQPMGPGHKWAPANCFNGVLHPIIPYGIKGVIWYQGEGNGGRGAEYRTLLPVMIGAWRKAWGQGDFPFLIVQLPGFLAEDAMGPSTDPNEVAGWPLVREAQAMTAREVANCGMVVAIDLGHFADLHPGNKEPIGRRLAMLARKMVYGEDVVASGPVFKGMKVKGKKATLSFGEVGRGLVVKEGEKLGGFAVAGADKKFVWAEAEIVGETVVVSGVGVKKVMAVRYLWNAAPVASLYNVEGLPAGPFRTDGWEGE